MSSTSPATSSVYPSKNIFEGSTAPVYVDKPKPPVKKFNSLLKTLFPNKINKYEKRLLKKNSIKLRKVQKLGL